MKLLTVILLNKLQTTMITKTTKLSHLQHGDVFSFSKRKNAVLYVFLESPFEHMDYSSYGLKNYPKSRTCTDSIVFHKGDIIDFVL